MSPWSPARRATESSFCSVAAKANWIAFQFHPEKSGAVGLKLYRNFVEFARQG